jgi:hypothetical protein
MGGRRPQVSRREQPETSGIRSFPSELTLSA